VATVFTKIILFAVIAACGVEQPPEFAPPDEPPQEDQHFCCGSVDPKTWTGDDCSLLSKEHLVLCNTILYCPGKWTKEHGHVTCG
jgi:predicted small lipoprotein YifL